MTRSEPTYDVVIPTVGRSCLATLLSALAAQDGPLPGRVLVVDDRPRPDIELALGGNGPGPLGGRLAVLRSGGKGPAAARNVGWRASSAAGGTGAEWVAFLDDDVVPSPSWARDLSRDLGGLPPGVGGSCGRIVVPLPVGRRATDWERNVAGLERARWATADLAYRRSVLERVGGFDERFPRAYREDADLALRVIGAGHGIAHGSRVVEHPVRPADRWVSVRLQRGNADDPLMRALHGPRWRATSGAPAGRRPWHLATTASLVLGVVAATAGRRRIGVGAMLGWAVLTGDFARRRIAPGPRSRDEVVTMVATSVFLPPAATWHWLRGWVTLPSRLRAAGPQPGGQLQNGLPAAVLFDRDGTLVHDVPYNGDPAKVAPVAGAREAVDRVRNLGIPVAVVSNQSGVGRGLIPQAQVDAVNARIEALLGPFEGWFVCPHAPEEGCTCRKPQPELVLRAARRLGVDPSECVLIGDIGADVQAAHAAGARAILVPTPLTRPEEVAQAPEVAPDLLSAVENALGLRGRR